jgi:uncharacterized protein with von Willebrand factor type A (vWA) domain
MLVTALRALGGADVRERGVIADLGVSSGTGGDELFVIEADESDGTFLLYDTSVALITNVDPDHLDHWESRDAFYDGFVRFGDAAREAVVISADDSGARRVARALRHERIMTFGEDAAADVRLSDVVTEGPVSFAITHDGETVTGRLAVPGPTTRSTRRAPWRCCSRSDTRSSPPCVPWRVRRHGATLRAPRCPARRERLRRLRAPHRGGRRWLRRALSSATVASSPSSSPTRTRAHRRCTASSPMCSILC